MKSTKIKNQRCNKLLDKEHCSREENIECLELLKKEEPSEERDSYIAIIELLLSGNDENSVVKLKAGTSYNVDELIKELKKYPKDSVVEIVDE